LRARDFFSRPGLNIDYHIRHGSTPFDGDFDGFE
jgi:hypothetical protein